MQVPCRLKSDCIFQGVLSDAISFLCYADVNPNCLMAHGNKKLFCNHVRKIISLCLAFGEILLGLNISSSLNFQKIDIKAAIII